MSIETCISHWHSILASRDLGGLDELLAEDVVFYSPIVFTPQAGRKLTKLYLTAAYGTFGGDGSTDAGSGDSAPAFRYTKQVLSGNHAVLEFETQVDGKFVNGVDIISCDDDSRIIEFKVMLRPLQAVNLMHEKMRAMLATLEK